MAVVNAYEVVSLVLLIAGAFFLLVGSIGIVRLPDFFTRTHDGLTLNSAKLLVAAVFVALTGPVGAHALARAAYRSGLRPWYRGRKPSEDPTAPQEHPSGEPEGAES